MMERPSAAEVDFAAYVVARGPALRRTAYLVVGDWHVAEDVTQIALTRVYKAWHRIRSETLVPYARRAVVNEALSAARRIRREWPVAEVPDRVATPSGGGINFDVEEALSMLAPRQRAIIALRFLDDLPVTEVAQILGIAEGTVKSQTSRALATLRHHIPQLVLSEEPT